ncbi:MAG: cell division protein ZapA [Pseudomonadota bacterium]
MARVEIVLNGREYPIACEDGQEDRVREVAGFLEERLTELRQQAPNATDSQLLVMVSLMVADELFDANQKTGNGAAIANGGEASDALARLAGRIEELAVRLEGA